MIRVNVKPELLRWARVRAGMDADMLVPWFPKYLEWESEKVHPTLKQLEKFAKTVHVPIGSLFLSEPPDELVPIPDFRSGPQKLDSVLSVFLWYFNKYTGGTR